MCRLILFLPVFGLPVFWMFAFPIALPVSLAIVLISIFLYFKVFQAMRAKFRSGREAMVGRVCLVIQDIDPEGKIQYATEIWNAFSRKERFLEGDMVVITGFSGLKLLVNELQGDLK